MELVNATPHPIDIVGDNGDVIRTIAFSGVVARCHEQIARSATDLDGIPVCDTEFGDVYGLPEPQPGVYYIVSHLVREALPERDDLLVPVELVRDASGRIIGCRSLARTCRFCGS